MMSFDEKIDIAIEQIHQETDRKMTTVIYIVLAIHLIAGVLYAKPLLAILDGVFIYFTFYLARFLFQKRLIKNIFICLSFSIALLSMIALTNGLVETRFYYFILLFLLVLYQSPFIIHLASTLTYLVTAAIFLFPLISPQHFFSKVILVYFIEPENVSFEKFIFSILSEISAHIGAVFFADFLYKQTYINSYSTLANEEQILLLENNKTFADEIAKGNLDIIYNPQEGDTLGKSLLNMRDSLKIASQKDEQERFISNGIAEVNEILRMQNLDLKELTNHLMLKMIQYLNASQGAIYLTINEEGQDLYLEMVACFGYDRKKYLHRRVGFGEGLIGEAYLEKLPHYLTNIPSTYQPIDVGLGNITPACVLIVPLLAQDKVAGVLEIASLKEFLDYERKLIDRVAENIASTILSVRINEETKILYAQSKIATEELQAREEEMRQNMEELEATQEEMRRSQASMLESQAKNKAFFEGSINSIISFQEDGLIDEVNPATLKMFGYEEDTQLVHKLLIEQLIEEFAGNQYHNFVGKRNRFTAIRKDKTTLPVQAYLHHYNIGKQNLLLMYIRDITMEVAQEMALRDTLTQLEAMNMELRKSQKQNLERLRHTEETLKAEIEELKKSANRNT